MKILIIIPAYNEAENIVRVVDNLINNYPQYDYVVINDGSKDTTVSICQNNGYNLIDLPVNLGLSGCVQTGMIYAYEQGYDYAIQFDGDGQHRAEYISVLVETAVETHADIVIGSRFRSKKKSKSMRMLGSNVIQRVIRLTTGCNVTDPTSGMRVYSRRVLKEFAYNLNYTPEPDTIAFLLRNKLLCHEVQVEMDERIAGESYLNFKNAIIYMAKMMISIVLVQWVRKRG